MALTLSGTNGVVGAGFTLDPSGASVTAGVGTFGSVKSSGDISGTTGTFSSPVNTSAVGVSTQIEITNNTGITYDSSGGLSAFYKDFTDGTTMSGYVCAIKTGSAGSRSNAMTLDHNQNIKFNSGFGSVSTVYGCRAWIQLSQGGSQSITGSGGVSSINDEGTGATKITFTTEMPDDNFAMVGGAQQSSDSSVNYGFSLCMQSYTTTYGLLIYRPTATSDVKQDNSKIHVAFFR